MNLDALHRPIETGRLLLRWLDASDLAGLAAVHGDDVVTRFIPSITWRSHDDALDWLARHVALHEEGRVRRWAVIEKDGERRVGDCMLFNFDATSSRAELGFVLGRRDWGRGVMSEAVGALLTAAFDTMRLRRIEAHVDPLNAPSDRLLRKLGFVHEGLLRQRSVMKGKVVDSNVYGLLRVDWEAASAARFDASKVVQ